MKLADPAAGVFDAIFILGRAEIVQVPLGESPHIHHKDVDVQVGIMLLGDDRFFGGVHAADGRAVIVALVAAADALQEGDAPGALAV